MPTLQDAMDSEEFLALALRNPVNAAISDELFRLALPDAWIVSGCLVQTAWNALTNRALDYGINDYDVFYFDPDTSWAAEDAVIRQLQDAFARPRRHGRGAQSGPRSSLVSRQAWLALPRAAVLDRRHRPLPDQEYPRRYSPHASWSRRLCARRFRRYRRHDRAAESRTEFFGGELRGEGGALEKAVAGDHGAAGGLKLAVVPAKAGPIATARVAMELLIRPGSTRFPWLWVPARASLGRDDGNSYRTTPEVKPALRRGGLMSFFRKQCADLPA